MLELTAVERPAKTQQRYGAISMATTQEKGVTKYTFEDSLVSAIVFPISTGIAINLTNRTDHSVKVVWDEAALVGFDGRSGRVMHTGVKYVDRNNPQPPSVIVRRASFYDEISPTENVRYSSYAGWITSPLAPKLTALHEGKTVTLVLPLQIQDVVNEYTFTFTVKPRVSSATATPASPT